MQTCGGGFIHNEKNSKKTMSDLKHLTAIDISVYAVPTQFLCQIQLEIYW